MSSDSLTEREQRAVDRMKHPDPAQEREWLDQNSLTYGALIGVGVLIVQPFLTAPSLDLTAAISVIAFSIAIPLLAALMLVNRQETFRGHRTRSRLVFIAQAVAQGAAFIGLVAAFWHIHWIAGVGVLLSSDHAHRHVHRPMTHTHSHRHDDGHHEHQHPGLPAHTRHTHPHVHEPLTHAHPHAPDLHHRHRH